MTRIRYLTLLLALLCGTAGAQDFNPESPAEPGEPPQPLVLLVTPAGSGSVAGAGRYVPGSEVRVSTSAATGFVFEAWTDTRGTVLSTQAAFTFEKKRKADTLVARYFYAPEGPSEPSDPTLVQYFTLTLLPTGGGTASGGGRYRAGSRVNLSASASAGFVFEGWFDAEGKCLSAEHSFTYVTTTANVTLTPRFRFDPQAPSEPSEPVLSHNILLEATDGGTASAGNMRLREGSSTTVTARANEGYEFVRWLMNGEPYTELPNFSYTMGRDDVTFRAEFRFAPAPDGVTAHEPCLLHAPADKTEGETQLGSVSVEPVPEGGAASQQDGARFAGNYDGTTTAAGLYGVTPDDRIVRGGAGAVLKSFRAAFDLPATAATAALRLVHDGTTGTGAMPAPATGTTDVHTIDGRLVKKNVAAGEATQGLRPGIYIINKKKTIIP